MLPADNLKTYAVYQRLGFETGREIPVALPSRPRRQEWMKGNEV